MLVLTKNQAKSLFGFHPGNKKNIFLLKIVHKNSQKLTESFTKSCISMDQLLFVQPTRAQ